MFSEKRSLAGQLKLPQRRNPLRVQYLLRARFYPPRLLKNISFWASWVPNFGRSCQRSGRGGLPRRGLRKRITYPGEKIGRNRNPICLAKKKNGSASRMHPTDGLSIGPIGDRLYLAILSRISEKDRTPFPSPKDSQASEIGNWTNRVKNPPPTMKLRGE